MPRQIYQIANVVETEAVISRKTASLDGLVRIFGDTLRSKAKIYHTQAEKLAMDVFRDTSDREVRQIAAVWLDRNGCGYVEVE